MRLDKILANLKYGSRKDIKKIIKDKKVLVNNQVVLDDAYNVDPLKDVITLNGEEIYYNDDLLIMLNKPSEYICSNQDEKYPSVLNLIDDKYRRLDLNIAGRLDYDTLGLVLLTNNGKLLHEIISPRKDIFKTYLVKALNEVSDKDLKKLSLPMALKDKNGEFYITKNAKTERIDKYSFYLSISEGKFHQVKEMVKNIDNEVLYLKRVKIGNLELGSLSEGEYLVLNESERKKIFNE